MKTLLRLLSFLSPFRWLMALAFMLGSIMIASSMGLLGMAAYLIAASALGPLLVFLTIPIYMVQVMGVTRALSRYIARLVSHNVTFRLLARLRVWAYSRVEPQAPAHLLNLRSGDMLTRFVADIEELQNVYLRVVSPVVVALVISLFTFGVFAVFSMGLAWVALAFLAVAGSGVPFLAVFLSRSLGKQRVMVRAELNTQIVDGLQGIQDILAYGRERAQLQNIAACERASGRIQSRVSMVTGLQAALHDVLMNAAMWVLLILAIPLVATRSIDGVYLGVIGLLILASFEAVQPLAAAFQGLGQSLASANRVFTVTDAAPPVVESKTPRPIPLEPDGYTLSFEQVQFAYRAGEQEILGDISFALRPGSRVAVVGPSGAGKSTLARLALRFWDPTGGVIRLNGQDIREIALRDLRALIGVVAQDTFIFNETLRANLLLARPGASVSELETALEQAQLIEFVRQLPRGLKTWVGEQGLQLSGGERQRLAIARAFLKNAPILILDEATAHLDPVTEHALLAAVDELARGRTTLQITHRLLAMEHVGEILVLNHGRIVERGNHEELLAIEGYYRQLFETQNGMLALMGANDTGGAEPPPLLAF
jgi:ATP-binding cassette, subfamily C, bacterial CydC